MPRTSPFLVPPGRNPLPDLDPDSTPDVRGREEAEAATAANVARVGALASTLWADNRYALLVLFQGMDTSGKDGAVRSAFAAADPTGLHVTSFKQPSAEELEHDFLWRIHAACPRRGEVAVFNRSHYEDVGIVRVHGLVPRPVWEARYDQINAFERHLVANGTRVVKFFLHISRAEQKQRLLRRIQDPLKGWKMEEGDIAERRRWPAYMKAYGEALARCSTREAPWHAIPADKKWYRDYAVASVLVDVMESMNLRVPKPTFERDKLKRALS